MRRQVWRQAPGSGAGTGTRERTVLNTIKHHRDRCAGGLIILLGLAVACVAAGYPTGNLQAMGPGFFPLVLGALMLVLGVMIVLAGPPFEPDGDGIEGLNHPEIRGWLCILGGVVAFILLAQRAGMVPGTFTCVFVAAMGDRTATWTSSAALAAAVAAGGVLLFHYGLQVQLSPFAW